MSGIFAAGAIRLVLMIDGQALLADCSVALATVQRQAAGIVLVATSPWAQECDIARVGTFEWHLTGDDLVLVLLWAGAIERWRVAGPSWREVRGAAPYDRLVVERGGLVVVWNRQMPGQLAP